MTSKQEQILDYEHQSIFYDGFTFLKPVGSLIGVGADKVNFLVSLVIAMFFAHWFRKNLGSASRATRANAASAVGFLLCYFCYGKATLHLVLNAVISYGIIVLTDPRRVHVNVFLFSMAYLMWIHGYRWLYQRGYCLDMTGSMMVAVGKVTLLAASVYDGKGREDKTGMTHGQIKDAVKEIPSFRDYFSYMFNFQSVLCGPMHNYSDYSKFLDNTHVKLAEGKDADPTNVAIRKAQVGLAFLAVSVLLGKYDVAILTTPAYLSLPLWRWCLWWVFNTFVARTGYYFAWIFADGICNMSGFGFSGYDKKTNSAKWDLTTNVRPMHVELGLNYKEMVDNWNILTVAWLRRVVYERVDHKYRTVAVYVASAVWHGFAAGYYYAFLTGALFTLSAAMVRRCVRRFFLADRTTKFAYDAVGFVACRIAISYVGYPFFITDFWPGLYTYRRLYFIPHLLAFAGYFVLPLIFPPPSKSVDTCSSKTKSENSIKTGCFTPTSTTGQ
ncbi:unnamed protein product [Caenorhabditis auriculariae]|uniref:Uncharacterized protein n=1 Tax=Caenorhabditis auriculariae TaxID=2777116 RepID=A0A8S1HCN5_9PELO|nr:unnamed protein product [Caenorhabditis auriculariae]